MQGFVFKSSRVKFLSLMLVVQLHLVYFVHCNVPWFVSPHASGVGTCGGELKHDMHCLVLSLITAKTFRAIGNPTHNSILLY